MVGGGKTVTVTKTLAAEVQPPASVTVTEYVVLPAGDTLTELADPPVDHAYALKPDVLKIVLLPKQTVVLPAITGAAGVLTVTFAPMLPVQPPASVTVTL